MSLNVVPIKNTYGHTQYVNVEKIICFSFQELKENNGQINPIISIKWENSNVESGYIKDNQELIDFLLKRNNYANPTLDNLATTNIYLAKTSDYFEQQNKHLLEREASLIQEVSRLNTNHLLDDIEKKELYRRIQELIDQKDLLVSELNGFKETINTDKTTAIVLYKKKETILQKIYKLFH